MCLRQVRGQGDPAGKLGTCGKCIEGREARLGIWGSSNPRRIEGQAKEQELLLALYTPACGNCSSHLHNK